MLPYHGFWSLLCGPFYAHVYSKWQIVLQNLKSYLILLIVLILSI
jgi:hypothetical protein